MICIIALNSVDVAAEIVHLTDGLNLFAVIVVRTNGGDRPDQKAIPVRQGRADAAVNAGRWDHRVGWERLEPRVLLVQQVKTEQQDRPVPQVQLEQQALRGQQVVRPAQLPRQYMHNKENAVTMRLSAH